VEDIALFAERRFRGNLSWLLQEMNRMLYSQKKLFRQKNVIPKSMPDNWNLDHGLEQQSFCLVKKP
jgi:hypothetical protein